MSVAVVPEHIVVPETDGAGGTGITVTVTGVLGLLQLFNDV